MDEIGVRDLKANLSEYIRRARQGDTIVVTDRGRPAAILAPVPGRVRLDQGIEEGWVTPAVRRGLRPVKRHRADRRVLDVLDEDRGE